VYGAMMEQTGWSRLAVHLQAGHTLYTYDRRGRGESTELPHPPAPLSLRGEGGFDQVVQTEVGDLLGFVDALRQPLDVFGHSSGALLVLHAAVQGMRARRLVLYEPVLPAVREPKVPGDLPARILAHVAAGDRDAAMEAFMRDGMWLTEVDIERARGSERWRDQLRYVHTAAYDVQIARSYVLEPERLAELRMPVLLLVGSESPAWMKQGVEEFASALPDARVEILEGQGHNAQFTAPDVLAWKMRAFLAER
jgi:pimeloyl-ACP methyl ester carboxylesterase